ncbi:hypothetical protein BI084_gp87 [Gordonia phage Terapin]|uniref:Uncharacterized protein n=3 Tax=Terapinvirus terapin TaxID=2734283 RepID=A0A345MBC6_9CAUD|nr:hypothetical protein BI084_gp87 [Gordonia phage Terapin]AOE44899.1 hypothetical protein SEA_TERAPIN_87 [Gordonia phage Terapin]AVP43363.1 hypothetical protein PBI_DJOKOVIC_86 [Gordonia phage Djokovic]AXH67797.1 hypothetical protein SEA_BEYONCAGE_86 [Gordonia phage Beyoncage]
MTTYDYDDCNSTREVLAKIFQFAYHCTHPVIPDEMITPAYYRINTLREDGNAELGITLKSVGNQPGNTWRAGSYGDQDCEVWCYWDAGVQAWLPYTVDGYALVLVDNEVSTVLPFSVDHEGMWISIGVKQSTPVVAERRVPPTEEERNVLLELFLVWMTQEGIVAQTPGVQLTTDQIVDRFNTRYEVKE